MTRDSTLKLKTWFEARWLQSLCSFYFFSLNIKNVNCNATRKCTVGLIGWLHCQSSSSWCYLMVCGSDHHHACANQNEDKYTVIKIFLVWLHLFPIHWILIIAMQLQLNVILLNGSDKLASYWLLLDRKWYFVPSFYKDWILTRGLIKQVN